MRNAAALLGMVALGACGDGPAVCHEDGGAACFELPTEAMRTYEPGGSSGVLLLGCGPVVPAPSTIAVALGGNVTDYDTAQPVVGATLEMFAAADYEDAIASATTDANGAYSMNLPSGTPDLLWGTITNGGAVPQLLHHMQPDLGQPTVDVDFTTATPVLLDMAADRVEVDRNDALAQLTVHVQDCNRRSIVRAVVVLSSTAGQRDFVDGVPIFYSVVGSFPLPTSREQIEVTGNDGTAVAINVPVDGGELYVQAWGFPDAAAIARGEDGLVLVAEHAVARRAGTTTWVNLRANQN